MIFNEIFETRRPRTRNNQLDFGCGLNLDAIWM